MNIPLWRLARLAQWSFGAITALAAFGCTGASKTTEDWALVRRDDLVLGVNVTGSLRAANADFLGPPPIPTSGTSKSPSWRPRGSR